MHVIVYYKTKDEKVPVLEFLDKQTLKVQSKLLKHITLLSKEGPNLRRPYADYLESGIYELRVKFSPNEYRVLYFFAFMERIVLTHGFTKKSSKIPNLEVAKALKYKLDFERRIK